MASVPNPSARGRLLMAPLQSLFPLQPKDPEAVIYRGLYCVKMTSDPLFQNRGGSSDSGASKGFLKIDRDGEPKECSSICFPKHVLTPLQCQHPTFSALSSDQRGQECGNTHTHTHRLGVSQPQPEPWSPHIGHIGS